MSNPVLVEKWHTYELNLSMSNEAGGVRTAPWHKSIHNSLHSSYSNVRVIPLASPIRPTKRISADVSNLDKPSEQASVCIIIKMHNAWNPIVWKMWASNRNAQNKLNVYEAIYDQRHRTDRKPTRNSLQITRSECAVALTSADENKFWILSAIIGTLCAFASRTYSSCDKYVLALILCFSYFGRVFQSKHSADCESEVKSAQAHPRTQSQVSESENLKWQK